MKINFKKMGTKRNSLGISSNKGIDKISSLKGGVCRSRLKGRLIDFLPEPHEIMDIKQGEQGEEEILNIGLTFWVTDREEE